MFCYENKSHAFFHYYCISYFCRKTSESVIDGRPSILFAKHATCSSLSSFCGFLFILEAITVLQNVFFSKFATIYQVNSFFGAFELHNNCHIKL